LGGGGGGKGEGVVFEKNKNCGGGKGVSCATRQNEMEGIEKPLRGRWKNKK